MTPYSLKKKIANKFGSYANFARIVGMDSLRGKTAPEIDKLASRINRTTGVGRILPKKLDALRRKIDASGGVEKVCAEHGFSPVSVWQILQGRRKRVSPVVQKLFNHFGI